MLLLYSIKIDTQMQEGEWGQKGGDGIAVVRDAGSASAQTGRLPGRLRTNAGARNADNCCFIIG